MKANCLAMCIGCYPPTFHQGKITGCQLIIHIWSNDHQNCNGQLKIVFCFLNQACIHKNSIRWHQKSRFFILLLAITVQGFYRWLKKYFFLFFIQRDSKKWGTKNFFRKVFHLETHFPWSDWTWLFGKHNFKYLFSTWNLVVTL